MIVRSASANGQSSHGIKAQQERIVRTYRGYRPESAEEAYRTDAAKARAFGYVPISHRWTHDWEGHALTVAFAPAAQLTAVEGTLAPIEESTEGVADAPEPMMADREMLAEQPAMSFEPMVTLEPATGEPMMAADQSAAPKSTDEAVELLDLDSMIEAWVEPSDDADAATDDGLAAYLQRESSELAEADDVAEFLVAAEGGASAIPAGRSARLTVEVLDLHCAGEPLRMIRSGFPDVPDAPVLERRRWIARNADHVRRAIVNEPRGHRDMYGAILLPPHSPDADVCLLFMHNEGYSTMCGHGVIAVTTALIEEGLFPASTPITTIRYEVPAGIVVAEASTFALEQGVAVGGVRFTNVPSYLAARALPIAPAGVVLHGAAAEVGYLGVDLAFGGAYYGIVDAAALGLRVVPEQAAELRRAGAAITEALRRDHTPTHPTDPELGFVYGTIIVDRDPASSPDGRARGATLRNATIFADAELDRSPCGSGTSALLASMYGRGWAGIGDEIVNAGITGESFRGRIEGETMLGDQPAIVTSVEGRAFVTGYGLLIVDDRDPLGEGFVLG